MFSSKYFDIQKFLKLLNHDLDDSQDLANNDFKICNVFFYTRNLDANEIKLITVNALNLKTKH